MAQPDLSQRGEFCTPAMRCCAIWKAARWNRALASFGEAEAKIVAHDGAAPARTTEASLLRDTGP